MFKDCLKYFPERLKVNPYFFYPRLIKLTKMLNINEKNLLEKVKSFDLFKYRNTWCLVLVTFIFLINNLIKIETFILIPGQNIIKEVKIKIQTINLEVRKWIIINSFIWNMCLSKQSWNLLDFLIIINPEKIEKTHIFTFGNLFQDPVRQWLLKNKPKNQLIVDLWKINKEDISLLYFRKQDLVSICLIFNKNNGYEEEMLLIEQINGKWFFPIGKIISFENFIQRGKLEIEDKNFNIVLLDQFSHVQVFYSGYHSIIYIIFFGFILYNDLRKISTLKINNVFWRSKHLIQTELNDINLSKQYTKSKKIQSIINYFEKNQGKILTLTDL